MANPGLSAEPVEMPAVWPEGVVSDEELAALALAADPDQPLSPDAVPLDLEPAVFAGALPLWYMPPAMAGASRRWRSPVVMAIVMAFLLIDAVGLCMTYGQIVLA